MEKIKIASKRIERHERYLKEKDTKGKVIHYGIVPPNPQTTEFSIMELIELKLALEELDSDERYIIKRHIMDKAPVKEIASELNVSEKTIQRRKSKAINKLKQKLK